MISGLTDNSMLLTEMGLLATAACGALTDAFVGKIYNWLTLPSIVLGILFSGWHAGWPGLLASIEGACVGLLAYGWLYYLKAMGAGDVKFLMALGAWGGVAFTAETALLGILVGGLFSVGHLIYRGTLLSFARRMYRFLLTVFVKELEVEKPEIDKRAQMPFGVPIAIAAAWVALRGGSL